MGQGWDGMSGRKGDGERRARDGISPVCQPASLVYAPGHPPALQVAIPDFHLTRCSLLSLAYAHFFPSSFSFASFSFLLSFLPSFLSFVPLRYILDSLLSRSISRRVKNSSSRLQLRQGGWTNSHSREEEEEEEKEEEEEEKEEEEEEERYG